MAGVYSQMYAHVVFSVKGRNNIISLDWAEILFKYIAGIINGKNQKSIIVNGYKAHIHALIGLKPSIALSDLVRDIKSNSSKYVNDNNFVRGKFAWQEGFGAFTYSRSQLDSVYNYILNQDKHHSSKTFKEEYLELLSKFQIEFDEKYLFEWIE